MGDERDRRSESFAFCRPAASKFSGASHRSNAVLTAGHSESSIENHVVSRLCPFCTMCCLKVPSDASLQQPSGSSGAQP